MNNKTALIVDDAYFMRNLIKKALKEAGYEVVGEAKDGKEGATLYFELKPDFITMDIKMKDDKDGIEATKLILSKDPNAKIIAITGNNVEAVKEEILQAGAMEYLQKPFQPAFLWSKLEKMFKEKQEITQNTDKKEEAIQIITDEGVEDSFENIEIEILDKPDNSKEKVIVVENNEDFIEFPDGYAPKDNDKYSLNKENIELIEGEDEIVIESSKDEGFIFEQDTSTSNIEISEHENIEKKENHDPIPQQPHMPKKEDNDEYFGAGINIKPPRGRVLREEVEELDNIEEPVMNYSEDKNYNIKKTGFLDKVKSLFKK